MNKKNFIRLAAFLLIFLVLFISLNKLFNIGDEVRNEKASFYKENENSMEVLFCGSSSMLRDVSPMELYKNYGIAGYSLATVLQAPPVTEFTVKEGLRYQTPKVVVLNMESAIAEYNYEERETYIHMSLDPFRISTDKLKTISTINKYDPNQTMFDYLFPIVRYHGAWNQFFDGLKSLSSEVSYQKGYVGMKETEQVTLGENYMSISNKPAILRDDAMKYYRAAIQTCLDRGIEVVLVKLPRMTWSLEEHEALKAFAAEMGVVYLDFNEAEFWDATGLDRNSDFYDANHLNHKGAVKLSNVLGSYLVENYSLTDVREQESFVEWNDLLLRYETAYSESE